MKNILRKNQVIIAALAIMIVIAGYLNFTKGVVNDPSKEAASSNNDNQSADLSKDDLTEPGANVDDNNNLVVKDDDDDDSNQVGGSLLASGNLSNDFFVSSKLQREQTRAASEADLKEIIANKDLSDEQVKTALDKLLELQETVKIETAAETLLQAKGFSDALVTIIKDQVDVVVNAKNLSEQDMAQIQDIVKRKTGISAKNIVISPAILEEDTESEETSDNSKDATSDQAKDTSEKNDKTDAQD